MILSIEGREVHKPAQGEGGSLILLGIFKIVMPENYIAMFNAPGKEEAIGIVKNSVSTNINKL